MTPKKCAAMPSGTKMCTAIYVDDAGQLSCACVCDVGFSTSAGAALALIPAGAAAEAARTGKIPEEMFDNLREVLNIMASLFDGVHLRLRVVGPPATALAAPVAALVARPAARLDIELAVAGYAGGRLSLLAI